MDGKQADDRKVSGTLIFDFMIILLKFGKHSNKELGFKFDSLKSTISSAMTSNDFFLKLSPVIASVKEGHSLLSIKLILTARAFSLILR